MSDTTVTPVAEATPLSLGQEAPMVGDQTDKEAKAETQSKADAKTAAQTFWANVGKAFDKELKALPDGHYALAQGKVLRQLVQTQQTYAGDPPASK